VIDDSDGPAGEEYKGITIIRHRLKNAYREKMRGLLTFLPVYTWYLGEVIAKTVKKGNFDAIHVHDLYLAGGGLLAKKKTGIPLVVDLHENYVAAVQYYAWSTRAPGKWFVSLSKWKKLEKQWLNGADLIVTVIEENRDRLVKKGIPESRMTITPNTLNVSDFEQYDRVPDKQLRQNDEVLISYIGGFDSHRGLEHVIDAAKILDEEGTNYRLVMVGDGRTRSEIEYKVSKLGLENRVSFEGWQKLSKVRSYIEGSDICLIPHVKNKHTDTTIPHKLFQYMYCEKPVVSTNCAPIERIVKETGSGFIYDSGDAAALAYGLRDLIASPRKRKEMGENGRKAVLDQYNWDHTVKDMIKKYAQLG
jgi:glycosyltransferase involved in cell wall biosynthesis